MLDRLAATIRRRVSGSVTTRARRASLVIDAIWLGWPGGLQPAEQEQDHDDDHDDPDDSDAAASGIHVLVSSG